MASGDLARFTLFLSLAKKKWALKGVSRHVTRKESSRLLNKRTKLKSYLKDDSTSGNETFTSFASASPRKAER